MVSVLEYGVYSKVSYTTVSGSKKPFGKKIKRPIYSGDCFQLGPYIRAARLLIILEALRKQPKCILSLVDDNNWNNKLESEEILITIFLRQKLGKL